MLRPHDTVVALKLGAAYKLLHDREQLPEKIDPLSREGTVSIHSDYRGLGGALGISHGEIGNSIKRLLESKLIAPALHEAFYVGLPYQVVIPNMKDWLVYGIKFYMPAETQSFGQGVPTSWSNPDVRSMMVPRDPPHVWLSPGGAVAGEGVVPLYAKQPIAAANDRNLHYILSLVDAVRLGKPRELKIARELILDFLDRVGHAQFPGK